jgi:quercetin 2,3-dioxygenase
MQGGGVDVHRGVDRPLTTADGVVSRHCFSFGRHYDPSNVAFGPLVAVNDETLEAGSGFASHRHADIEIVTWVASGTLVHEDSTGERHLTTPGMVQRLSAGAGVSHTETATAPTRFIQMWVTPDPNGGPADYARAEIDIEAMRSRYAVVASGGLGAGGVIEAAVTVRRAGASLLVARLGAGDTRSLPGADRVHLFVVVGELGLETGVAAQVRLNAGDSARIRSAPELVLTARISAEVLVWRFDDIHRQ